MIALNDLKIGTRLTLGFGILIGFLILISAVAITRIVSITATTDAIVNERYAKIARISEIERRILEQTGALSTALLEQDFPEDARNDLLSVRASSKEFEAKFNQFKASIDTDKGRALLKDIETARAQFAAQRDNVLKLLAGNEANSARIALIKDLRGPRLAYQQAIHSMAAYQNESMLREAKEAKEAGQFAIAFTLGLAALATLASAVIGWVISRSITHPIEQAVTIAETVAAGDLTSDYRVHRKDEAGQLLRALLNMNHNLAKVVATVRNSSDSIATGSSQIATGNADLSQRTEQQASSLQQTAASMEQLNATVTQNADSARQADQLAAAARSVAGKGGEMVDQVVRTMDDITTSSRKISDIIGVIDGIAFQTNILALNAAVEAARAGEQGRGFAVVASEVRNLAHRSAEAAKEIKSLISASVERVEAGSRLVSDAGSTMSDIVAQVKRVSDLIGEISAATTEQTSGIGQVSQAVSQLDQVTQQNAALVEESAAAAESLRHQASKLVQAVSVFKIGSAPLAAA